MRRTLARYGRHRTNVAELWWPEHVDADPPVVVLVHGGYWRAPYTKRLMRPLAKAIVNEGWVAWNIEYRRLGRLGGRGGWPVTFIDVAAAVDALARVPGVDRSRVVTCGHSAGGHLALWAAARHRLPAGTPGASPVVPVTGVVSLAGVVDLRRGAELSLGNGAVTELLAGGPEEHPDRYAVTSPAELLPLQRPQVLVHGRDDTVVPPELSERYCEQAAASGDADVRHVPIDGIGHMEVIDPGSAAWPPVRDNLRRLLDGETTATVK